MDKGLSRRGFLKVIGLGAAVGTLAACSPTPTPVPPTKAPVQATAAPKPTDAPKATAAPTAVPPTAKPAAQPVKLVVTFWGGAQDQANVDQIAALFTKANPNISIEAMLIPGTYDQKLLTMTAGGTPPNVQATLRPSYYNFMAKKVIINLQPFLDKVGFKRDAFYEVGLRPFTYRRNLYGLPKGIDAYIVCYNKDLFDQAGVAYPDSKWAWDDLVANAKKLTKRDASGRATQFGFAWGGAGMAKGSTCYICQNGGSIVDNVDEPAKFTMAEPAAMEALQFMADLATVHKVMPNPTEKKDMGGPGDLFKAGKLAMLYAEWFSSKGYRETKLNWDIAEPARGKKQANWVGGGAWCVNGTAKNQEESANFVYFAAGPEGSTVMAKNLGGIPNVKTIAESDLFLKNPPPANNKAVLATFDYGEQPPMSPTFPEWEAIYMAALDAVWTGEKKVQEVLPGVVKEVQAKIDEGRKLLEAL